MDHEVDTDSSLETTKKIWVNLDKKISKREEKINEKMVQLQYDKKNRVIVDTKRWAKQIVSDSYQDPIEQYEYLTENGPLIQSQIMDKIRGYKHQDSLKGLLDDAFLVDYSYVYDLLCQSRLKCFYCHIDCMVLYSHVREPRQWTLDRLDNSIGHNRDNVEITCLDCNIRRGTKNFERYLETKKLNNIRKVFLVENDDEKII